MGRWVDRVKIVKVETLLHCRPYAKSKEWKSTRTMLHGAIGRVSWPPGSGRFTIYPESGKSRGCGNGVKPIKSELMTELAATAWIGVREPHAATPHGTLSDLATWSLNIPKQVETAILHGHSRLSGGLFRQPPLPACPSGSAGFRPPTCYPPVAKFRKGFDFMPRCLVD
jgi:hypothetical protein